jgi:hypothetical protein
MTPKFSGRVVEDLALLRQGLGQTEEVRGVVCKAKSLRSRHQSLVQRLAHAAGS